MIKTGIIGLGKIAQTKYIPALLRCGAQITVICDRSASLVRQVCAHYGFDPAAQATNLEQVMARKPDLVFLLNHDHYDVARQLLCAGIGVCVEKPLCWSAEQAAALCALAKESNVPFYAAYMKQFDPAFQAFQAEIREQGLPLMLNVTCYAGNNKRWCDPQYRIFKEEAQEKADAKHTLSDAWAHFYENEGADFAEQRSGSQTLLQLGIHQINLIHALVGDLTVCSCDSARQGSIQSFSALFQKDNTLIRYGLLPLFSAPWLWEECYEAVYPDRILTYAPGSPFLATSESVLRIRGGDGLICHEQRFGLEEPFCGMIRALLDAHSQGRPILPAEEAVRDIATIEQMLRLDRT